MKTAEEDKPKNKVGRPTDYTFELTNRICEELAAGKPIYLICEQDWAPAEGTVHRWLNKYKEFSEAYSYARERQQEKFAAEVITIADTDPDPARARNRMNARQWYAGKVSPKKWGDRVGVDVDAKIELSSAPSEALLQILAKLGTKSGG